jgi:hypothetical protein
MKKNIKNRYQKETDEMLFENKLINKNHNNKTFNTNKSKISDDISIDNISNIISYKHKLPNTQMIFEKKQSSSNINNLTNPIQNRVNCNLKNYKNFNCNNNTTEICDSHTKSFQLKLKKMKEMNRTIMKENYIMKNNAFNPWKSSWFNREKITKSIINCKQKIIYMKIKNQLLNKNLYIDNKGNNNINGNINNKLINTVNEDNGKKIKQNETIPFLCCFSKS